MNICRDCRHWHQDSEYIRKHRDGKRIGHGWCDLTGGNHYEPETASSLAYACGENASGFYMFLGCDEDFGCVQFEAKS